VWTWRSQSSKFEAVIEWTYRYTPWQSSCGIGDRLGGRNWKILDKYRKAVNLLHFGCWHCIQQVLNLRPWECRRWPYYWASSVSWLIAVDCGGRNTGSWSYTQGSMLVLAIVLDCHFGSGSGLELNCHQIVIPGCRSIWTVNVGMFQWKSPNLSALGELFLGCPAAPCEDSYNAVAFPFW